MLESGAINAEQVLNVLARVSERMPPERVETAFQIIEEPLADTSRYDILRRDPRPES